MFLWGFAMMTVRTIGFSTLALDAPGFAVIGTAAGAAIVGPLGLITARAVSLAFWPPGTYLRWISTRAAVT